MATSVDRDSGEMSDMDTNDSRKRPLDGDIETGVSKRSHHGSGYEGANYHFKILVPSVASGAIIGKGGETIAQLQKDSGTKIKMSKASDFYPGTTERICLIVGSVESIMQVHSFIMEKIREKPDPNAKPAMDYDHKFAAERDKQVKILVPNSTAGMIIGKGGSYIKQIKEETGTFVQISQKAKDQQLTERCITVIGEPEQLQLACRMILGKIADDPQSNSCPNVSYSDFTGPVANVNPSGSPYAHTHSNIGAMQNVAPAMSQANAISNGLANTLSGIATNLPMQQSSSALFEQIQTTLRNSGFSEQATAEITVAMNTLATYGILAIGLNGLQALTTGQANNNNSLLSANYTNSSVFGPVGSSSGMGSPGRNELARYTVGDTATATVATSHSFNGHNSAAQNSGKRSPDKDASKVDLEINDNIVGAILGPGGRTLVEIQQFSGANIQISKKGIYAPGTQNRVVTITGDATQIQRAQFLMHQKISNEEAKRMKQGSGTVAH